MTRWERYTLHLDDIEAGFEETLVSPVLFQIWREMAATYPHDMVILTDTHDRLALLRDIGTHRPLFVVCIRKER